MMRVLDSSDTMEPGDVAVGVECSSLTGIMMRSMESIPIQDAFFSTVNDGNAVPAFHPSGVGEWVLCVQRHMKGYYHYRPEH